MLLYRTGIQPPKHSTNESSRNAASAASSFAVSLIIASLDLFDETIRRKNLEPLL